MTTRIFFILIYAFSSVYSQEVNYEPQPINQEMAESYIKEMWYKSPYSNPINVEVKFDCMIAYYSDVKGSIAVNGLTTKNVTKVVFFREVGEIILINKGKNWYVNLKDKKGKGLRNFKCQDEELAKGFIDSISLYISMLPKK